MFFSFYVVLHKKLVFFLIISRFLDFANILSKFPPFFSKIKKSRNFESLDKSGCGGKTRTYDLRVMSSPHIHSIIFSFLHNTLLRLSLLELLFLLSLLLLDVVPQYFVLVNFEHSYFYLFCFFVVHLPL